MCTVRTTGCCGVLELVDISRAQTAEDVIRACLPEIMRLTCEGVKKKPFIYYTGVVDRVIADHASVRVDNYGQALTDYIREHKLGEVIDNIPPDRNYSGNTIKIWIWRPDYQALQKCNFNPQKDHFTEDLNRATFEYLVRYGYLAPQNTIQNP